MEASGASAVHQAERGDGRDRLHHGRAPLGDLGGRRALHPADQRAVEGLAQRAVADSGDVALVGHEPGQLDLRPALDVPCQRDRRGRRADRRALGADHQAAAEQREAHVELEAHAHGRGGRGRGARDQVEPLRRVHHHDRAVARFEARELRQGAAIGGGVGQQQVAVAVAVQPQGLAQRERHEAAKALVVGQDAVEQRAGSAPTSTPPGPACRPSGRASRPRWTTSHRGPRAQMGLEDPSRRAPAGSGRRSPEQYRLGG